MDIGNIFRLISALVLSGMIIYLANTITKIDKDEIVKHKTKKA